MLQRRLVRFVDVAHRITRQPTWELLARIDHVDDALLRRCRISRAEWARWSPVVPLHLHSHAPDWVVAVASVKVASVAEAEAVFARSLHALPLLVLAAHSLAHFSLVARLPTLAAHLAARADEPHPTFYYNALLRAISYFDRSRLAADIAVHILHHMQQRRLPLWPATESALIRDNFRSPRLLDCLRHRPSTAAPPDAWLRAYASLGSVHQCARYLHAVEEQCLEKGIPPPYPAEHGPGAAHKANTHYLRALCHDRPSAFRYFHRLLEQDMSTPSTSGKSIDIYDWTTALYAAAHDRTLSASAFLDLFVASRRGTDAYKPTRATYTVLVQGLLWRNALQDAQRAWDEFVAEVVAARGTANEDEMWIDRKALCVGIDLLVQCGRADEAVYLLDEAVKRDHSLTVHPIHALFTALLRIRRPDAIFYVWTHLSSLYSVPPTNLMLRVLLKAAIQASRMDGESVKGAMRWYMADNPLFKKVPDECPPSRDELAAGLHALFHSPTPPPVVGIWAHRRSTHVARSIFRGMIFGNWPALRGTAPGGVTRARAGGGDSVFQEFARVFASRPDRVLPTVPDHLGAVPCNAVVDDERLGPPLPTVMPSESTFATYVALLGLSSRADEIPEVLGWMRALGVVPKTETLAVALVFWMEVGLRGPVFEDGWRWDSAGEATRPRTEYGALRAWMKAWVGERAPKEEDIYAGIKRVKEMRDSR